MAEEDTEEQGENGGGGGGGGRMRLILVAVGALLVGLLLASGGWWLLASGDSSADGGNKGQQEQSGSSGGSGGSGQAVGGAAEPGILMKLDNFVVNLARTDRPRYLKITLKLGLKNKATKKKAKELMPRVRDALIIILSNQGVEDLESMQGKYELKRQIIARLNKIVGPGAVTDVYYTEFVIQ